MNFLSRLCKALTAPRSLFILGGLLLCVALVAWPLVVRYHRIAEVQQSIVRNYEITFNDQDHPKYLPGFLDRKLIAHHQSIRVTPNTMPCLLPSKIVIP